MTMTISTNMKVTWTVRRQFILERHQQLDLFIQREVFGSMRTFKTVFDRRAEGVVCSNPGK